MHNILYIINVGYQGGVEKFTHSLIRQHLANDQYRPILLFFSDGPFYRKIAEDYEYVFLIPFKVRMANPLSWLRLFFHLIGFITKHKIVLAHIAMPWAKLLCLPALIVTRTPFVWFQHGPIGGVLDKLASLFPFERLILYNSTFTKDEYHQESLLPINSSKEKIVNPIIEIPQLHDDNKAMIRSKFLDNPEQRLLICAGRICSWKGYEIAIHALANLRLEDPDEWLNSKLIIIGSAGRESDREYEFTLHELVKKMALGDSIMFLPFSNDLPELLHASDIFIHCSRKPEPFGLVVGEAMLAQTLVIGSNQGGIQEILIDGQTGFSFDSCADMDEAIESLCQKLRTAITLDNSERVSLARERVLNVYNSSKIASQIELYYLEITGKSLE